VRDSLLDINGLIFDMNVDAYHLLFAKGDLGEDDAIQRHDSGTNVASARSIVMSEFNNFYDNDIYDGCDVSKVGYIIAFTAMYSYAVDCTVHVYCSSGIWYCSPSKSNPSYSNSTFYLYTELAEALSITWNFTLFTFTTLVNQMFG